MALNRPTTCSSIENQDPYYDCGNGVDGDLATRWSSQFSDPQWIYVDLGARQYIRRVILHWEAAHGRAYRLQVSDDAVQWTDVYSTTDGDGEVDNLNVSHKGRYVRVYGVQRNGPWGYSLWEFEVYAGDSAVTVSKRAAPNPVQPGAQLTYTIRVTNTGVVPLTAAITDTLPLYITPGETSGGTLIQPGGTVAWTPVHIAPDGVWTETVVVTAEMGFVGTLTNTVKVTSEEGATAIATETSLVGNYIYLPLVPRD